MPPSESSCTQVALVADEEAPVATDAEVKARSSSVTSRDEYAERGRKV